MSKAAQKVSQRLSIIKAPKLMLLIFIPKLNQTFKKQTLFDV